MITEYVSDDMDRVIITKLGRITRVEIVMPIINEPNYEMDPNDKMLEKLNSLCNLNFGVDTDIVKRKKGDWKIIFNNKYYTKLNLTEILKAKSLSVSEIEEGYEIKEK